MTARTLLRLVNALSVLACALAFTATASAQTPSDDAYNRSTNGVIGEIETQTPSQDATPTTTTSTPPATTTPAPTAAPQQAGQLPFTGMQVGGMLLVGVVLLGTGVLLRRRLGSDEG